MWCSKPLTSVYGFPGSQNTVGYLRSNILNSDRSVGSTCAYSSVSSFRVFTRALWYSSEYGSNIICVVFGRNSKEFYWSSCGSRNRDNMEKSKPAACISDCGDDFNTCTLAATEGLEGNLEGLEDRFSWILGFAQVIQASANCSEV